MLSCQLKLPVYTPCAVEEGVQGREPSYPATPASSVGSGVAYLARPSSAELPLRAASVASSAAVTDDLEARAQPLPYPLSVLLFAPRRRTAQSGKVQGCSVPRLF